MAILDKGLLPLVHIAARQLKPYTRYFISSAITLILRHAPESSGTDSGHRCRQRSHGNDVSWVEPYLAMLALIKVALAL